MKAKHLPWEIGSLLSLVFAGEACSLPSPATPPTRLRSVVESILGPADTAAVTDTPLSIVWVWSDGDGHPAGSHDFTANRDRWTGLFRTLRNVDVTSAYYWPSRAQWDAADLVVFDLRLRPDLADSCYRDLDGYLARGKGLAVIHCGLTQLQADSPVNAKYAGRVGLSWRDGTATYREGDLSLQTGMVPAHPLGELLPATLAFTDEAYFHLVGNPDSIQVMARVRENGADWPMLWTRETGGGRVFASVLGHFNWTHDDPIYRILVLRGMAWAARAPMARFRSLVTRDASVIDDKPTGLLLRREPVALPGTGPTADALGRGREPDADAAAIWQWNFTGGLP